MLSLLLMLIFSYETSFLILIAFIYLFSKKDISKKEKMAWSFLLSTEAIILIYFISTHYGAQTDRFWGSLPFAFTFWKVVCCGSVLLLPFIASLRNGHRVISCSFIILSLYFFMEWKQIIDLWSSYNFRTLSVPLTSTVMIMSTLYMGKKNQKNVMNLRALAFGLCFFSSLALILSSIKWAQSLDEVMLAVRNHKGCVYKSYERYGLSDLTVSKHFFTPLSIVLQDDWRIDPILLTPITEKDRGIEGRLIGGKTKISNMEFHFGHSKTFVFPSVQN